LDVPGVTQDKLSIQGERNLLTISGSRGLGASKEKDLGDVLLKERRAGDFARTFVLPEMAQVDKAEAQLNNGLLEVRVPKTESTRRYIVPITRTRTRTTTTTSTTWSTSGGATQQHFVKGGKAAESKGAAGPERTRGDVAGQLKSVHFSAPQLLPIAAQLSNILRYLRQLQRQGGYSARDVTQLQEELLDIEMQRREDGTFGGKPDYEGTSAREALIMSLLHRAHRVASSMLAASEVDKTYEPVEGELEEIEANLEDLIREPPSGRVFDEQLHKLQERLDAVDAQRKNAAFPGPRDEGPLHGQAFLHNLLEHCYDLVTQLQNPSAHAGEIDPQLRRLHALLKQKVEMLEALRRKGPTMESELRSIRDSLIEVERNRIAGVFGGAPSAPPPKGQAVLSSLLHRAYRLLHLLEVNAEAAED
jgi:hypothetical protein